MEEDGPPAPPVAPPLVEAYKTLRYNILSNVTSRVQNNKLFMGKYHKNNRYTWQFIHTLQYSIEKHFMAN